MCSCFGVLWPIFKHGSELEILSNESLYEFSGNSRTIPTYSKMVVIINHVGESERKNWFVKRKEPKCFIRGGNSSLQWISWNTEKFDYVLALKYKNTDNFLFACADASYDRIVLSQPGPAPDPRIVFDNLKFQRVYSRKTGTTKLRHVASQKFVAVDKRTNRMVLKLFEEEGDSIEFIFHVGEEEA